MGNYLNSKKPYASFASQQAKPYFIDKSAMLAELFPLVREGENYLCITRPRRFGKTSIANMIAAFFGRGRDSRILFEKLAVAGADDYKEQLNKHNVISIAFNEVPRSLKTYEQYISRIERRLIKDLREAYPDCVFDETDAVWDILNDIFEQKEELFIFVFDEWDYVFHQDFLTEEDRKEYLRFLRSLLKDKPYVLLAYMTGILPIAKYSSGSELNMFLEYTMSSKEKYSEYFGFTEEEVDFLFAKYQEKNGEQKVSREGLRFWYDGYQTKGGRRIYNPRSVVCALSDNQLSNYWTSSGPYDEIFYYIEKNVDAVRDDIALMAAGIPVSAKVQEYAASSMRLSTRDEILSAMVVYGLLSSKNGYVEIPNKELLDKFIEVMRKEPSLGYVHRLAAESEKMLRATKAGDIDTMLEILEYAHNTEIPLLSYNNETDLTAVVNLVYLAARDSYHVEREAKAGIGYADFIFYPVVDKREDCLILELKVDGTAEQAVKQIKDRKYALRFMPKIGEPLVYTGRILAVGIAYDRKEKKHDCKIEVLRSAARS